MIGVSKWHVKSKICEYACVDIVIILVWCSKVNLNGLECLWRLRKLKVLKLRDMDHIQDIKLVCLMLLEENPDLRIEGVDYEDAKILEA